MGDDIRGGELTIVRRGKVLPEDISAEVADHGIGIRHVITRDHIVSGILGRQPADGKIPD